MDVGNLLLGIGTILAGGGGIWGVIYSVRKNLRSTEGKDRYDQLQEDLENERTTRQNETGALRNELQEQRVDIRKLQAAVRVREDYIIKLRKHIEDGNPPPPPPYPDEMQR